MPYEGLEGCFQITDRDLSDYMEMFRLTARDINNFPLHAKIMNIGGGFHRTFEKQLSEKRPDLFLSSIDPSLGVVTIDENGKRITQRYKIRELASNIVIYEPETLDRTENWESEFKNKKAIEYDRKRKSVLTKTPGAVAALATKMPFADDSFDILFDLCGPIQYLRGNDGDKQTYLAELKRVMKTGSKAYLSSIDDEEKRIFDELGLKYIKTGAIDQKSWIVTK